MERRGSRGPNAGSSYGKDGPSRRHLAGTRGYPYPQDPTRARFSPLVGGASQSQCDAFQSQTEHQQRQQEKQQHHQHQQQRQQQEILLEGNRELEPQYARPGPSQLPQPVDHGANQVRAEQGRYLSGYRIPLRDPRERTWSQVCPGSRGSTAAAASLAEPPAVAPLKKRPWPGMPPSDPRLAQASSSSSPRHRASTSFRPSSQAPQRHPVAGAEVHKEFAVPSTEASSRTQHGKNGWPPEPPRDGPSKEQLLDRITKIDEEISQLESHIGDLKKKQRELEGGNSADEDNNGLQGAAPVQPKLPSFAELIYSQNNERARLAHAAFDNFGPKVDQPLYRQPSDTAVYHENVKKFEAFKKPLTLHLKKTAEVQKARNKRITDNYNRLMQTWKTKTEKKENTAARKAKDKKQREFFEKQFPELKKQRESRERLLRAGNRVRSDAHMEEIIGGLQEQENADRKMRLNAVVPPILVDTRELRRPRYCDRNGLVRDPLAEYKERQMQNTWSDQEKEIFREKFVLHPKDFGKIASFLEKKSVSDCIRHYYLTKKKENYKQLLRKRKAKPQRKATNCRKRKYKSRK